MSTPEQRLAEARAAAGFQTATDAAVAMGVGVPTYIHHENGTRGFSRVADRYARFFRVSLDWLMTGRGDMRARQHEARLSLPILGKVGAGAAIFIPDDPPTELGEVEIGLDGDFIVEVDGMSQFPRFQPGEKIIVRGTPEPPARLVGCYAVVQVENEGKRLVKKIRRGTRPELWDLESHNDETLRNVTILAAWRVKGLWLG